MNVIKRLILGFAIGLGVLGSSVVLAADYRDEKIYSMTGSVPKNHKRVYAFEAVTNPQGRLFTLVLTSSSGDADLYLRQKVRGEWKILRSSMNDGSIPEVIHFTDCDIADATTEYAVEVEGYATTNYTIESYETGGANCQ